MSYDFGAADMQRMRFEWRLGLAMRDVSVVRERRAAKLEREAERNLERAWLFWRRPKLFAIFAWRAARAAFLSGVHDARGTVDEREVSNNRMNAIVTGITS